MPCKSSNHHHEPWPCSGARLLVIKSCETICGWCKREIKPASNLRKHARRHVRNATGVNYRYITIASGSPGRGRLSASATPENTASPENITDIPPAISDGGKASATNEEVFQKKTSNEIQKLKSRITVLESALAENRITIPPDDDDQHVPPTPSQQLEKIIDSFSAASGMGRVENCLFLVDKHESLVTNPLYRQVVRYTSCFILRDNYVSQQAGPPELLSMHEEAQRELFKSLKDNKAAFSAKPPGDEDWNPLIATLLQLTANGWFWGALDEMLGPLGSLSTVITDLGGVQSKSVYITLGKMVIVADALIAIVHERLGNMPAGLDELGRRIDRDQPDGPLTSNKRDRTAVKLVARWNDYSQFTTDLGRATLLIHDDTVSLIRKVWSSTQLNPREHGNSRNTAFEALILEQRIMQQIAAEITDLKTIRSPLALFHNQKHLIPRTTYSGPTWSDHSKALKEISYIEGRSRMLILTSARIYTRAVMTRTPISRCGSSEEILELRSGIFEIPTSYWKGNEGLFIWIVLPLICILDSPQGRTDPNVSEGNRRYCKALMFRAAQVHAARSWSKAEDFLGYMTRFNKWLRKESDGSDISLHPPGKEVGL